MIVVKVADNACEEMTALLLLLLLLLISYPIYEDKGFKHQCTKLLQEKNFLENKVCANKAILQ